MEKAAYYKVDAHEFGVLFKPLTPTGRWKLETSRYHNELEMFIEHRGWFFRRWVSEKDIVFRNKEISIINDCNQST